MSLSRKEVKKGFFWNAVELYSSQIVQFIIGIIMARLLMPNDYAIIGMITVFLCISDALISSGFPTALIRKKHCTDEDYSTVFYFNIFISVVLYIILWICAPLIASFYGYPILTPVTRAMGLKFLIGSFSAVSETILKRNLKFRIIAIITLSCSLITGIIAIYFAYTGLGVWALVIQAISVSVIRSIFVLISAHWWPSLCFSIYSFKELFGFGSKVLGSNMVTQIYQNMYNITIGKFFPASTLAYFTRADGYSKLIPINVAGVIQKSLFPMLAKIQENKDELLNFNHKMTNLTSFIIFPASLILAGLAYPIISIMLTDKWIATAPLLQILCVSVLPEHLYCINNDFIMIQGRSDIVMREQTYTKLLSVIILAISIPFGIECVAIGKGLGSLLTWIFSACYIKKVMGIKVYETIINIMPIFISSVIIGGIDVWLFTFLNYTLLNTCLVGILSIAAYVLSARMFFPQCLTAILNIRK